MTKVDRPQVKQDIVDEVLKDFDKFFREKRQKKGMGAWISMQEMYGKLSEERHETLLELHAKNPDKFIEEMRDVAVVALWSIMSIKSLK